MNEPHQIVQTASLTEKSTLMSEKLNKYVFPRQSEGEQGSDQERN